MAYLGNSPVLSQQEYRNIDNISGSFNGVTTSFALLVNGVAPVPAPQSSNQCLISVNGVVQKPDDTGATGFRISGGNIIFSSAPTGGQSFFGVILAGADYIYAGENFPDGTVSAPSITFAQDTDTGFFRSGAGEIKYTANGTAVVTLSSNNLTAPSFIPTSSSAPTNGVYLPAANTVGISTNGSGRLFINSSGYTSIGNSSPQALVHFGAGTSAPAFGTASSLVYVCTAGQTEVQLRTTVNDVTGSIYTDSNGVNVRAASAHPLSFHTSNTERLRITSAGLVGVGTSSPSFPLHVSSANTQVTSVGISNTTSGGRTYRIVSTGSANSAGAGTFGIYDDDASAFRAVIDSSGRVGIGTTSPGATLDVNGAINASSGATTEVTLNYTGTAAPSGGNNQALYAADRNIGLAGQYASLNFVTTNGAPTTTAWWMLGRSDGTNDQFSLRVRRGQTSGSDQMAYSVVTTGADSAKIIDSHRWFTNGSERARLTSSGQWLVGTSSARSNFFNSGTSSNFQIEGTAAEARFASIICSNSSGGEVAALILGHQKSGAVGGNTILASGDGIGRLSFQGSDGSEFVEAACVQAEVDGTPGANDMPGRLVFSTTADGASSPTERVRITQAGVFKATNSGSYQGATSDSHEFRNQQAFASSVYISSTSGSFERSSIVLNCHRAANTAYNFLLLTSNNEGDNEFVLRGDGNAFADGTWSGGGADYAEYFEWVDSNPNEEDRRGISVVLDGDKIREAVAGEDPIGVISGNPSVVGDAAWNKWSGKYLRDEFGTYLLDENGDRQLNSAYDPDQEYIPREQRPEWDCVGLMGKLRIRKGQITGSRWIKMRDISDSVEEWLVR